jgi:group I intron endonuclease
MEEEKKFTTYLHRCPNGKCYVGMTSQTPKGRWGSSGCKYKNNKDFYSDIEIYGWDNIEHVILEEGLNREDACESEKYNIKKYNCIYPNGYNLSIGGDSASLGVKRSEETKEKLRKINIGKKLSEETKERLSISQKNISKDALKKRIENMININKNKIYTKEMRDKISDRNKNRVVSKKTKEKISLANKGKLCGDKNPMYGIHRNPEDFMTKEAIIIKRKKQREARIGKKLSYEHKQKLSASKIGKKLSKETIDKISNSRKIKVILNNFVFLSVIDCKVYCAKFYKEKINTSMSSYLNGHTKMPQKWIDRGLRYYNPETDSHLPIYVDTKDEV